MEKIIANEFFNYMRAQAVAYDAQSKLLERKRKEVADKFGWDSPQMELIKSMKEELTTDFTNGEWKAYRAWNNTIYSNRDAEKVVMKDWLGDDEVAGFVNALRTAEQETFIYAGESTALMRDIHGLIAAGCKILGTVTFEEDDAFHKEEVLGLEFAL